MLALQYWLAGADTVPYLPPGVAMTGNSASVHLHYLCKPCTLERSFSHCIILDLNTADKPTYTHLPS